MELRYNDESRLGAAVALVTQAVIGDKPPAGAVGDQDGCTKPASRCSSKALRRG
jgi:hypothetical protein